MAIRPELVGQGVLPSTTSGESFDLGHQQSFAGALSNPVDWGVQPHFLEEYDRYKMSLMAPERIAATLIDVQPGAPSSVSYQAADGVRRCIALTPAEYSFISRSPQAIGEAVMNKTLAARPSREDFAPDIEAAHRSQAHTAIGYIEKMDVYIEQTLNPDRERLQRFQEYVQNPQLRRLRGDNLKKELEWVRSHIFEDMLVAMRQQRKWSPEQEQMARDSLNDRLFLDRKNNAYLSNWLAMLQLAESYTGHKWALFKTKQHELKDFIR